MTTDEPYSRDQLLDDLKMMELADSGRHRISPNEALTAHSFLVFAHYLSESTGCGGCVRDLRRCGLEIAQLDVDVMDETADEMERSP
jgi:hypothetical protein